MPAIPPASAFGISADGHELIAYRYATASHTPEPVALGNVHVGATASTALTVTNSAAADGYSEKLDVSLGALSTGITGAGSISLLGAGASNSTAITAGFTTATAGAFAGTETLDLTTDGSGTDGGAPLSIGTQTVNVTGNVYAYATASLANGGTVSLGNHHVGSTATGDLQLTNATATNGFSEALDAALINPAAGVTATGQPDRPRRRPHQRHQPGRRAEHDRRRHHHRHRDAQAHLGRHRHRRPRHHRAGQRRRLHHRRGLQLRDGNARPEHHRTR